MSYCLICKNQGLEARAKVRDYFSNEQFTILICPSCQTGRTYPFLSQKEVVPYYQNQNYICHSDTKKGAVNVLYHFVRQYMLSYKWHKIQHFYKSTSNIRILDYGSGTGYFLNYCQKKGCDTVGIEPEPKAREFCQQKFNIKAYSLSDLTNLPNQHFNVITAWHVLEHVENLKDCLRTLKSKMEPEGLLFLALPNHHSYDASYYGDAWAAWDAPRHLWHMCPQSMDFLIKEEEFCIHALFSLPFDPFYIALMSELQKGNEWKRYLYGAMHGLRSFWNSLSDIQKASSVVYVLKVQK